MLGGPSARSLPYRSRPERHHDLLEMDKSTLIGIGVGLLLIYGSIFMGQGWQLFFDIPSIVIVLGGTTTALLVTHSFAELGRIPGVFKNFLSFSPPDTLQLVNAFIDYARIARREGLLALDRRLDDSTDPFTRFGLEMAVDGIDETEIDGLLQLRLGEEARENQLLARFFTNAGTYAPAFGMIGTLIGLIQMMQSLSDPAQIGAGMAVALVTTFYGALFANLFFLPMATKAKAQAATTLKVRQLARAGVLAIVRGESPTILEKRLQSFLEDGKESATSEEETPLKRAA